MHFLKAWAAPLAEADRQLRSRLRAVLTESLPRLERAPEALPDARTPDLEALPPLLVSNAPSARPATPLRADAAPPAVEASDRRQVLLAQLHQAFVDCLSRPSRSPLLFGGLRGYDHLEQIVTTLARRLPPHRETPIHPSLRAGHQTLARTQALAATLRTQPAAAPAGSPPLGAVPRLPADTLPAQIGPRLRPHLQGLVLDWGTTAQTSVDRAFALKGLDVLTTWGPDLFHCYRIPDLPPSNTALEALFGQVHRHQRHLSGHKETVPLQRHAHLLIWRLATSCEHLYQILRSVSDRARRTARYLVAAAEACARWLLLVRHRPVNATAALVSEYLDLLVFPTAASLPLAA